MKPRRHLFFDPFICSGCRSCELACSQANTGGYNPDLATLRVLSHPDLGSHVVTILTKPCICKDGLESCVEMCHVSAIRFVDDVDVPGMLKEGRWLAAPLYD